MSVSLVKLFIQGDASPYRQLQFLEELLTLVPGCRKSAGHKMDAEMLLNEVFSAENLPHLSQMLEPTFNPWPAHIKYIYVFFYFMQNTYYIPVLICWMLSLFLLYLLPFSNMNSGECPYNWVFLRSLPFTYKERRRRFSGDFCAVVNTFDWSIQAMGGAEAGCIHSVVEITFLFKEHGHWKWS